ncbi:MAG: glycerophosphodiester phosphodiesterase family protein [Spirochaetes bacterium]|nr:glycerophosphodiester phosphodiesterase family protein [Spirochaetota bacterium]
MRPRPFPDLPRPVLFAHRGISSEAPENTFAAFALAVGYGIPAIELDIHRCASGELVVIHDAVTDRTADAALDVVGSKWERLAELDAGSWKGPSFAGQRIPLLSEVFEEFAGKIRFDVEIKAPTFADRGTERALADLIRAMRLESKVVVSSFNPYALKRFKSLLPGIPTGIIYGDGPVIPWYLRRGQGRWLGGTDFLKPDHRLVGPCSGFIRERLGGRSIIPWTVDDPVEARRLVFLACEGIISNTPHTLGMGRAGG